MHVNAGSPSGRPNGDGRVKGDSGRSYLSEGSVGRMTENLRST